MKLSNSNRPALQSEILERASTDAAFRARLISDPRGSIADALGTALPDPLKITILEETSDQLFLVLPAWPDAELSDADLADLSGGNMQPKTPVASNPGWSKRDLGPLKRE